MHKLLILSKNAGSCHKLIQAEAFSGLELLPPADKIPKEPQDCDIILGEPSLIRPVLDKMPLLRWVQSTFAGVEPLLEQGLRQDYMLTNARGVFGGLMSEYVLAYLLLHERRILQRLENQTRRAWDPALTGTLKGKTIGLLGAGSIGAEIAKTAAFFGMTVYGYTFSSENSPGIHRYFHGKDLFRFAESLDYLVSSLPDTAHTRKIINRDLFQRLPDHALFINIGRGSTVDENDLIESLNKGDIAGAVLDVFDTEPLPPDHPLWQTPNTYITSHTAAPSFPKDITELFSKNYQLFLSGRDLEYRVDFKKGY